MLYPGLLHPEPLPLQQSTADLYLHRRHSNTVQAQTLWGLWVLVLIYIQNDLESVKIKSFIELLNFEKNTLQTNI